MSARAGDEGNRLRRHQARGRARAWPRPSRFLAERGVPVMGHVGLTPQSINTIGSFRAQGREEEDWAPIEDDASAVADAGAFSVVIEAVAEPLARKITGEVADPDHRHRRERGLRRPDPGAGGHARAVAAGAEIRQALRRPRPGRSRRRSRPMPTDVRSRAFPGPEHVYAMRTKNGEIRRVATGVSALSRSALCLAAATSLFYRAGSLRPRWRRCAEQAWRIVRVRHFPRSR